MNNRYFCKLMKTINEIFHFIAALGLFGGVLYIVGLVTYAIIASIDPSLEDKFIQSAKPLEYLFYALVSILFGFYLFFNSKIMKKIVKEDEKDG